MYKSFFGQMNVLLAYQNAENAKNFLQNTYHSLGLANAEEAAYTNCSRFIYSLEHGEVFLKQSAQSPLSIQPVLTFYGLSHYLKACLLTVDPTYPATVQVLAHGLSARKRKKQNYSFLKDEVRTQRHGLFSHFSEKMFHVEHIEGSKLKMNDLLIQIPELAPIFSFQGADCPFHLLKQIDDNTYSLSSQILDDYQMTERRLTDFINQKTKGVSLMKGNEKKELLLTILDQYSSAPCRLDIFNNQWLFSRSKTREAFFPDLLIYYPLIYNLSMIARYETEWWYELLKFASGKEFSLIKQFLSVSNFNIPFLIDQYLKKLTINHSKC